MIPGKNGEPEQPLAESRFAPAGEPGTGLKKIFEGNAFFT